MLKTRFFKTYLKESKQIGSFTPSSRFLVKKMCDKINFKTAKYIIELGSGTGVLTKEILKQAQQNTKIFVFELNEDFYKLLQKEFNDPRLILINDCAEHLRKVLQEHQVKEVDAVLSSLPFTTMSELIKNNILDAIYNVLKKDGVYIQYQYSLNAKKLIEKRFGKLKMSFVSINLPPAFIYCGVKD
ncbi:MAG: methyltransferase [Flavobacteriaceae bacterium]|nr:methyltransferase [Flavobacteriaceae bacterium]